MRVVFYGILGLMIFGLLGGVAYHKHRDRTWSEQVAQVQQTLLEIQHQAIYRASIKEAAASPRGFAMKIEPEWIYPLKINPLVSRERAWLEIAAKEDGRREHPTRITDDDHLPGFWYNPYQGLVRARVPRQISLQDTVNLYNSVNGTNLLVEDVQW